MTLELEILPCVEFLYEGIRFRTMESLDLPGYAVSEIGSVMTLKSLKVRFGKKYHGIHHELCLCLSNGVRKLFYVHVLEAKMFLGVPSVKEYTVDHIDRLPNNNLSNLRWATKSEQNINRGKMIKSSHYLVERLSLDGKRQGLWKNPRTASVVTGYPYRSILRACKERSLYRGSLWQYTLEYYPDEKWVMLNNSSHETIYVSSIGRVATCRIPLHLDPTQKVRISFGYLDAQGYRVYHVKKLSSGYTGFRVHRLIAHGFYGESDLWVNHKDSNRSNNHYSNLEYVTASENTRHAVESGNVKTIEVSQFDLEGNYIATFSSLIDAARVTSICYTDITICSARKIASAGGYVWRRVGDYSITPDGKLEGFNPNSIQAKIRNQAIDKDFYQVKQYNLDGYYMNTYENAEMAGMSVGVTRLAILAACTGKSKTAAGFIWSYKNAYELDENGRIREFNGDYLQRAERSDKFTRGKPIQQLDPNGFIVAEYQNAPDAERKTKIWATSINAVCNGKRKIAGGFIWRYK